VKTLKKWWGVIAAAALGMAVVFLANRSRGHRLASQENEMDERALRANGLKTRKEIDAADKAHSRAQVHKQKARDHYDAALSKIETVRKVKDDETADALAARLNDLL